VSPSVERGGWCSIHTEGGLRGWRLMTYAAAARQRRLWKTLRWWAELRADNHGRVLIVFGQPDTHAAPSFAQGVAWIRSVARCTQG
jgi:hypothetical protein